MENAMDDIIAGVRLFQREVHAKNSELFERLAAGQSPDALIITCSDSRVDPTLITQARPGQLFELRNAGNLVPRYSPHVGGVTATIEFAVVALKVPNIIICGHSECGAMAGLLNPEQLRGMPRVAEWLNHSATVRDAMAAAGQINARCAATSDRGERDRPARSPTYAPRGRRSTSSRKNQTSRLGVSHRHG